MEKKNHFSFSSGVFVSKIEYSRDISMIEVGAGIESGFPNLFIGATISNPEDILENLKDSFTLFVAAEVYGTFDVVPSQKHDLDLGVGIEGLYMNLFENNIFGVFLNGKARYAYNFSNGARIFIETNIPTVAYTFDTEGGDGAFSFFSGEGVFALVGLFGTKLGFAFAF